MRSSKPAVIVVIGMVALSVPGRTHAQSTDQDQLIGALRKQLEDVRSQLAMIQSRIDELTGVRPGAGSTLGTVAPARPAERVTTAHAGQATSTYQTVSEDAFAAARFDNVPVDPKYHGYFILPGTQTLLKIGGFFKTDFMYDFDPTASPDQFIPSLILIPTVDGVHDANVSMRPTRLSLDFLVPSRLGDARLYLEGDFFGINATTPRLRHAYAQARNLLIGQTFTNFMDPDAFPDLLDVRGPTGMAYLRNPQVRYGFALDRKTTLRLSVEKPQSDVDVETSECHYAAANLIWNPFGTLNVGAEYLLGWYERKDRQTGSASRIQVSLKYAFVRLDAGD